MKTTRKHLPFCLFLLVLVWKSSLVQAQSQSDTTYTGSITVTTQAQVNALNTTLAGKTIIRGNLTIGYPFGNSKSNITDLTPLSNILSNIIHITGEFVVAHNNQLTALGSFPALQTVGGRFVVYESHSLTDMGEFPSLQTIGGRFEVGINSKLTDLGNFPDLKSIGESFWVHNNDSLTDVGSFPDLKSIGGNFSVHDNWKLTYLGEFPVLTSIIGAGVTSATFPTGSRIGASIVVIRNYNLVLCSWLEDFLRLGEHAVTGRIHINNNASGCNSTGEINDPPPILVVTTNKSHQIAYNSTNPIPITFKVRGATSWTSKITYTPVDANFITRSSSEGTDQTGAVTITATPTVNTGIDERTATITLTTTGIGTPATQMIVIRQDSKRLIVTTNKNHQIAYDNIDPISISFTVRGSATGWTSEITYTPVDANFITRSSSEGTDQRGAVTITATPTVNTGIDERTATITLTTTGIGTPATQMIVIRQGEANTDNIALPPADTMTLPPADTMTLPPADTMTLPPADTMTIPPADTMTIPPADTMTLPPADTMTLPPADTMTIPPADTMTLPPADTMTLPPADTMTLPPADTMTLPPADTMTIPPADTMTLPPADTTTTLYSYTGVDFSLYPNPTKGNLTIEGITGYLQIYIHDLVGREVMTYSLTPSKKTLDVSNLPSGMYVVTVQAENKTWTEVLVIVN